MKILLVGTGYMAREYYKYLSDNKVDITVVGRGSASAEGFNALFGVTTFSGGLDRFFENNDMRFDCAIIATSLGSLCSNLVSCLSHNISKILIEKPGFLCINEINKTCDRFDTSRVYVAYNRRFFSSVIKVREIVQNETIVGLDFDFSEWMFKIDKSGYTSAVLNQWAWVNSSHVIDLAFHLAGIPKKINAFYTNREEFYQNFRGAGMTHDDVIFSYKAHWNSASRWSIKLFTTENQYILEPLEKLKAIKKGSVEEISLSLDNKIDIDFKPGLALILGDFLGDCRSQKTLSEQIEFFNIVELMSPSI